MNKDNKMVSVYKAIAISAATAAVLVGLALLIKKLVERHRLFRCECEYEDFDDSFEETETEPELTVETESDDETE